MEKEELQLKLALQDPSMKLVNLNCREKIGLKFMADAVFMCDNASVTIVVLLE
jgi:hypothetical protein